MIRRLIKITGLIFYALLASGYLGSLCDIFPHLLIALLVINIVVALAIKVTTNHQDIVRILILTFDSPNLTSSSGYLRMSLHVILFTCLIFCRPLRAFHAVFASRVILHISKTQVEESRFENDFLSTVQFSMRKTETSSQIFLPTRLSEDELTELDHDIFSSRQQKFPSTSISIDP